MNILEALNSGLIRSGEGKKIAIQFGVTYFRYVKISANVKQYLVVKFVG